jgi:hypothetical protein
MEHLLKYDDRIFIVFVFQRTDLAGAGPGGSDLADSIISIMRSKANTHGELDAFK